MIIQKENEYRRTVINTDCIILSFTSKELKIRSQAASLPNDHTIYNINNFLSQTFLFLSVFLFYYLYLFPFLSLFYPHLSLPLPYILQLTPIPLSRSFSPPSISLHLFLSFSPSWTINSADYDYPPLTTEHFSYNAQLTVWDKL